MSDQDANGIGRYGRPTVALHWVVALTLIVAVVLGLTLGNTPEEASNRKDLFDWHRWVGVTVFALVLVGVVAQMPVAADVGSGDERDELGSG